MTHWTILTCEYPPDCGGVGDYTAQVAAALAAAGRHRHGRSVRRGLRTCRSEAGHRSSITPASRWWFSTMSTAGCGRRAHRRAAGPGPVGDPDDDPGPVRANRLRPSRGEHSVVPLAPRALAATWDRRARDVSRALLRVHVASRPAERPRPRRASDGEDAPPRRLARVCVDRRVAPIPGASHAGTTVAGRSSRCRFRRRFRAAIARPKSRRAARSCWGPRRPGSSAISARLARRSRRCSRRPSRGC